MTDVNDGFGADDPHDTMFPLELCVMLSGNVYVSDQENVWREEPLVCWDTYYVLGNMVEVLLECLLSGVHVEVESGHAAS